VRDATTRLVHVLPLARRLVVPQKVVANFGEADAVDAWVDGNTFGDLAFPHF